MDKIKIAYRDNSILKAVWTLSEFQEDSHAKNQIGDFDRDMAPPENCCRLRD